MLRKLKSNKKTSKKKISKKKITKKRRKNPLSIDEALDIIAKKSKKWADTYNSRDNTVAVLKTEWDRRSDGTIKGFYNGTAHSRTKEIREDVRTVAERLLKKSEQLLSSQSQREKEVLKQIDKTEQEISKLDLEIENLIEEISEAERKGLLKNEFVKKALNDGLNNLYDRREYLVKRIEDYQNQDLEIINTAKSKIIKY